MVPEKAVEMARSAMMLRSITFVVLMILIGFGGTKDVHELIVNGEYLGTKAKVQYKQRPISLQLESADRLSDITVRVVLGGRLLAEKRLYSQHKEYSLKSLVGLSDWENNQNYVLIVKFRDSKNRTHIRSITYGD